MLGDIRRAIGDTLRHSQDSGSDYDLKSETGASERAQRVRKCVTAVSEELRGRGLGMLIHRIINRKSGVNDWTDM